jgi:dihydrodiol dehydrogenase / D-xylose 1-dehydrogenase (NADP)
MAQKSNPLPLDIIYVGILNQTHCRWVCACLDHGKNVLCEKPMALSGPEAEMIVEKAREKGLFLMEVFIMQRDWSAFYFFHYLKGFWSRFFPVWQKIRSIIDSGQFGAVKVIDANFGVILVSCGIIWNSAIFFPPYLN